MLHYILRRLIWSLFTIFGVMILTFLLFRTVAGDIASAWVGPKSTEQQKADWRHSHGYDQPKWYNTDRRLALIDRTGGSKPLSVRDTLATDVANALALVIAGPEEIAEIESPREGRPATAAPSGAKLKMLLGRYVASMTPQTPLDALTDHLPLLLPAAAMAKAAPFSQPASGPASRPASGPASQPASMPASRPAVAPGASPGPAPSATPQDTPPALAPASQPASAPSTQPATQETAAAEGPPETEQAARINSTEPAFTIFLSDGSKLTVELSRLQTAGDLIDLINNHPDNRGRVEARITPWHWKQFFESQFFHHLWNSVSFQSRSLKDNRTLTQIIGQHMGYSLALMIPAMVLGWLLEMIIASLVAYHRGSLGDTIGVFLSVLGMCIPFLAFMMYGQWLMFKIAPTHAYGIFYRANIYVPVAIMVIAGMGASVRFYRTVILDETNRDYVRTARAKGVPLPAIMFKHILKNCMLPILTSLVLSIPFLIMGNLLVETYFGIPGLGDLMITSINERNEPILNGMVFLTSVFYTLGVLLTDISYAVFDPRIRLQ